MKLFRPHSRPRPRFFLVLLLSLISGVTSASNASNPAIIPLPQKLVSAPGVFELRPGRTSILADPAAQETAKYLAAQLQQFSGCDLQVRSSAESPKGNILLTTKAASGSTGPEAYELSVTPEGIVIRAQDTAGLFYGVQSLLQLLPPPPATPGSAGAGNRTIPCVHIQDRPRFKWRGMMLDVSRHFFSKAEVEQVLDAMSRYKLNTFHWHLADDQGWRIEIKKYPRLTQVGAWRQSIGFGLDPKLGTAYGPDGRYGGFYTQDDIREVVAYAAARHITIVPEIEMPGHASAALMAYPQYSCTGGPFTTDLPGGIFNGVYCAGNDETFAFLEGILTEVFTLFPGKYIHVGGDEVLTTNWSQCAKCQTRLKAEGLKKDIELESYFIRRMEKFIVAHQRTLVGWSEIREGGLAESAVVMDWVGGAVEAANAGHDVVMSPLADCYFDHYQSEDHSTEPHAIGGFLPLRRVYAFEPLPAKLSPQYESHILGAQANVWTEYMPSLNHVEYMMFPRLCALAEVVWSPKAARDWNDFNRRLQPHYVLLERLGLNYRHPLPPVRESSSAR
jgi:hexosaminidase